MRTIYHFPIIHSLNEVSVDVSKILKDTNDREILDIWEKYERRIKEYWQSIESWLHENIKDFHDVVIYLDSLPILDPEDVPLYFLELLSACPSCPNYKCVKWLIDQGASLEGTDHFRLLRLFEEAYSEMFKDPDTCLFYEHWIGNIVHRRDRFIAQRIKATLPNDRIGLLFLGWGHSATDELLKISKNIRVIMPSVCYAADE